MKKFSRRIKLLLAIDAYFLLAAAMLGPIYALFVEETGGDLLDASITFFVFNVASGITSLFFGKFADEVKYPEKIIAYGRAMIALGYFLYIFVGTTTQLFLVQLIIGVGIASASPAYDEIFAVSTDKHKEGIEWGAWESMNYFSAAFGAIAGGFIVTAFGFEILFLLMSTLTMITIPLALHVRHV